jgi:hypothetical protein
MIYSRGLRLDLLAIASATDCPNCVRSVGRAGRREHGDTEDTAVRVERRHHMGRATFESRGREVGGRIFSGHPLLVGSVSM